MSSSGAPTSNKRMEDSMRGLLTTLATIAAIMQFSGAAMALPAIPRRARNCYVAPAIPWIGGVR